MVRVIKITDAAHLQEAFGIREKVFVGEQGVERAEEFDQFEDTAYHFLAISKAHGPCGTARWRFTEEGVKLERFAVIPQARKKGVGKALLSALVKDINSHPNTNQKPLYLHAQITAVPLYQRFGFSITGPEFQECGITHCKMIKCS